MVKYWDAIRKPFTDLKKLIIGILLSMIPIVDSTLVTGFEIESSGLGKAKPSKKMPEWRHWKYLFMKGFGAVVIKIAYMLPAIILIGIGVMILAVDILQMLSDTMTPNIFYLMANDQVSVQEFGRFFWIKNFCSILTEILKLSPLFIAGGILFLLAEFLSPIAVLNYLKKRKLSAAFEFGLVFRKSFTVKYILAVLAMVLVAIVFGSILVLIPFVGIPALSFLIGVIGYSLLGQVYKETK